MFVVSIMFWAAAVNAIDLPLKLSTVQPQDIKGSFSLILFDSAWGWGIQRLALLDIDQDDVVIEPYVPVDEYRIVRNLSGEEACRQAIAFLSLAPDLWSLQFTRISDARGKVLGYEIRPLFFHITYGKPDVLEVGYRTVKNTIYVHIRLIDEVDRQIRGLDH
jgi:hypothetical protein